MTRCGNPSQCNLFRIGIDTLCRPGSTSTSRAADIELIRSHHLNDIVVSLVVICTFGWFSSFGYIRTCCVVSLVDRTSYIKHERCTLHVHCKCKPNASVWWPNKADTNISLNYFLTYICMRAVWLGTVLIYYWRYRGGIQLPHKRFSDPASLP